MEGINNLMFTRTQEKGAVTPQETESDLPVSVQESLVEAWVGGGHAAQLRALSVAVCAWEILKEVAIIFIISIIVYPQSNNREGIQSLPSTENWFKDLYSMAPPIRTRPRFPLSQPTITEN